MMQPAESRPRDQLVAIGRHGCWRSTSGRVFPQPEMGSVLVIITDILSQQPSQVSLIQNNHVIEQVAPYAANPALRNSILPGTAERGAHWLGADSPATLGRFGTLTTWMEV